MNAFAQVPPGRIALVNGRVILPDTVLDGHAVLVESGRIAGVGRRADVPADVEAIDVGQRYIAPGLIDIHTHGALGHSFNEPDIDAFAIVTREQATRGVTALLATIATAPVEDIVRCCE